MEVLLEPARPLPLVAVVGERPAARTLAEFVRTVGWRATADSTGTADRRRRHDGRGDEAALAAALGHGG